MTYSKKQQEFFDLALSGKNIFLTGKAGTGKSFILQEVIKELSKSQNVAVVAPTGVAANNVKGATIHSVFSLPIGGVIDYDSCQFVRSEKRDVLDNIDVLIVDEISMVRPDMLDGMHLTMKKNGCDGLDLKQVILVGDMAQLQPVMSDNFKTMILKKYRGFDFTRANIFSRLDCVEIELDEVLRQSDEEFIYNLNIVREGGRKVPYFRKFLSNEPRGIVLAPHNTTVKYYNKRGLDLLDEELLTFTATIEGRVRESDFNFESHLELKHGCKVMYLVNSRLNNLVNGTIGTFLKDGENMFIQVGGELYPLERVRQEKMEYVLNSITEKLELREIGSIEQYPVKLAYAVSIHKSQGLTFDEVSLDLTKPCFAKGQLYVALSRVTSPNGLRIIMSK